MNFCLLVELLLVLGNIFLDHNKLINLIRYYSTSEKCYSGECANKSSSVLPIYLSLLKGALGLFNLTLLCRHFEGNYFLVNPNVYFVSSLTSYMWIIVYLQIEAVVYSLSNKSCSLRKHIFFRSSGMRQAKAVPQRPMSSHLRELGKSPPILAGKNTSSVSSGMQHITLKS